MRILATTPPRWQSPAGGPGLHAPRTSVRRISGRPIDPESATARAPHAVDWLRAPGPAYVHRAAAAAPPAGDLPAAPGFPAMDTVHVEQRVESLVRENLERWRKKNMRPERIAADARGALVRQLVRERERLGR